MEASAPAGADITVLMPVHNDWFSAAELVRRIDQAVTAAGSYRLNILMVDDGSTEQYVTERFQSGYHSIQSIRVLHLRRNLSHQRAIAIGLVYIYTAAKCEAVLVMDADGEDTAEGVVKLLSAYFRTGGTRAIFAERKRRAESLMFKSFYHLYRLLHRAFTGISVRAGNFSILPATYLKTLAVSSELWNHYAAAVFRSRLPYDLEPIARGKRIAGTSRMNFVALVIHGLSAISVFGDIVGVRIMIASLFGVLLTIAGICITVGIRFFTNRAVPGWATYTTATLIIISMQLITIAASFTFFVLSNRTSLGFLPLRDYSVFVDRTVELYAHNYE